MPAPRPTRHDSGSLTAAGVLIPLAILIAAPVFASVYAYAEVYIPLRGWVTVFLLGGFACGLAWAVDQSARVAKCRSIKFVREMGAVAGVFGLYCSWVAFAHALLHKSDSSAELSLFQIFVHPIGLITFASDLSTTGWYSIADIRPTGALIWFMWTVEAAVVIGVPTLTPGTYIRKTAFCEACDTWCAREAGLILTGLPATPEVKKRVEAGDFAALSSLPPKPKDLHSPRVQIELQSCPRCNETGALTARILEHHKDGKGKMQVKTIDLVPLVPMTSAERGALRRARAPQQVVAAGDSTAG